MAMNDSLALSNLVDEYGATSGGLWRDLIFASGLHIPGAQQIMYRSKAGPIGKINSNNPPYFGSE
jgi:hypothetical protein